MTVHEAIGARKSIRRYEDRPVETDKLARVLEAGRLAPSASNQQRWRFVVVTDPKLGAAMAEACSGQAFVSQAPVQLVVCAADNRVMSCGQPAGTIDAAIALSFMMLAAAEEGLGTCWLGSFSPEKLRGLLDIPDEYDIVAVSPLGYPAEEGRPRSRKGPEEIIVKNRWA